ncbi:MAG TPA: isoleucine--tRNA ligase [Iamia sp.]|nr:isoleucine--tRNA ligase [Iamia sp.]
MFDPLPDKPDHPSIEQQILALWEAQGTFDAVRAQNADGPRFSFVDGPVTANKTLAVHTAWGRTLKDVFQRYKALQGFHQRYQNGFDCQGLWIEVGVEKELGLNSKREIEEYGLAEFARRCRAVVERYSDDLTRGSVRLGQWMDWENSYFTFSDTNISYIWRFLKEVEGQGRLYRGHRSTEWCPRCGTSISAHELVGSYVDQTDPSLFVRFPLLDRPGEAVVVWTTTPWTLPANVAAAVAPTARYGLRAGEWRAVERTGLDDDAFDEIVTGADMVGWRYEGPYDDLRAEKAVEHRVIPWDEVSMDDGTGIVHIAPGCGTEDFGLGQVHGLPVITPVDESGLFYDDFGWLAGKGARAAADEIIADVRQRGRLVEAGTIEHRYPECWRCHTPLIFRISDDWFIRVDDELRQSLRDANASVEWTPAYMGKRMDDWLVNMGDWNISRRRYYGLPLPFYPCSCGHITVIGSKEELAERAVDSLDGLEELRRPWIDDVRIRCVECGDVVTRVTEVGDVWLDAGIVPFSTLGWQHEGYEPEGYATGAAKGLTRADLPDHAYWEEWFPADWVSEMREQIRLWFYSQLFMSVVLTGRAPYRKVLGYEKMLDETGREMHGSWGNMISAEQAFEEMGADVMRWQYCAQPPNQNLLFGFGPAADIKRKLLTLWNSASFLVQYAVIAGVAPSADLLAGLDPDRSDLTDLDRWALARTAQLVAEAEQGYEEYLTVNVIRAFEAYVDDLSNWYIRRSRRRFWDGDPTAIRVLWSSLTTALRTIAPVMPFLAEHLWQRLVVDAVDAPDGVPASVFLAGWPSIAAPDAELLADTAAVRRVVGLGRQARDKVELGLRQPLRRLVVEGEPRVAAHVDEIASELRVKEVTVGTVEATQLKVRPNLKVLGPKLGPDVVAVRKALETGDFVERADGGFDVAGHSLTADEVLVERTEKQGWSVAAADGVTLALDIELDDELRTESRVYNLIHTVNGMRKDAGLALTDRIVLTLPHADQELDAHVAWIEAEVLAVEVGYSDVEAPVIAKA